MKQSSHLFITSSLSAARSTGTTVWSRYCKQKAKVVATVVHNSCHRSFQCLSGRSSFMGKDGLNGWFRLGSWYFELILSELAQNRKIALETAQLCTAGTARVVASPHGWAQRQGGPPGERWQAQQHSPPLHAQREPQQGGCPWSLRKHQCRPAWWQQRVQSLTWQPLGHHVSQLESCPQHSCGPCSSFSFPAGCLHQQKPCGLQQEYDFHMYSSAGCLFCQVMQLASLKVRPDVISTCTGDVLRKNKDD